MIVLPAIDLRGGRAVRLTEGDYARETVYEANPLTAAARFAEAGAKWLHVVDLDGALSGGQDNLRAVAALIKTGLMVEVGGGMRDAASAERYLDMGARRVILGTAAVENPALLDDLAARFPGRVAAGVDARDGFIYTRGWKVNTGLRALDFLAGLPERGVSAAIYTDIARDGMRMGANLEMYGAAASIGGLDVIASGGVTRVEEITALSRLGAAGAIIGKALYEGDIDLKRALAAAEGR